MAYRCSSHPEAPETPGFAQVKIMTHVSRGGAETHTCLEADIRCLSCSRSYIGLRQGAKMFQGLLERLG